MRDTDVGTALGHRSDDIVEVGTTAPFVDIEPIGVCMDGGHFGACSTKGIGCHLGCRTIRAIDDNGQSGQRLIDRIDEVLDVSGRRIIESAHPPHSCTGGPCPGRVDRRFDRILDMIGQLVSARGEELDAVIRHGIVRCGDHHTEIGGFRCCQVRQPRSGDHTREQDIHSSSGETRDHGGFQELPAGSRIAPDDLRWGWHRTALPERARRPRPTAAPTMHRSRRWRAPAPRRCRTAGPRRAFSACCTAEPCGPSSGRTSCAPSPANPG